MVSIYIKGEDKTQQISDWKIWWGSQKRELMLTCRFPSGKSYTCPLSQCEIVPTEWKPGTLLGRKGSVVFSSLDCAVVYGKKYAVIYYAGNPNPYVMSVDELEFAIEAPIKNEPVFDYFQAVANARVTQAKSKEETLIAENVQRQLAGLSPHPDTALTAYCTGRVQAREAMAGLIYPFGVNESQIKAVEKAFASQVSVIEGPPGTGKTQTVLNIIANILLQGKTVTILSNNNTAVANVSEKLGKAGLDYLVAKLGNTQNRALFFANPQAIREAIATSVPELSHIDAVVQELKKHLHAQNCAAVLEAEIDELKIERERLQQCQQENVQALPTAALKKYKLSSVKTADLLVYLTHLAEQHIRLKDRITLWRNFRIFRTTFFADWEKRKSVIDALQIHYYDKALQEKSAALAGYQETLKRVNFNALLDDLVSGSMAYLKHHVHQHVRCSEQFDAKTYRDKFDAFVRRYPIISSSTHSILNSVKSGTILDYAIIDEASQQDIVPGVLALGCVRNLIIVGDRKQLPHIPVNLDIPAPSEYYDCDKYSLLDSCIGVFGSALPTTLLKEHYRCHPRIIQFCNQQFYNGQLIPMKQSQDEQPLKLIVTAKGNHTRSYSNQRELDSLIETFNWGGEPEWDEDNDRGFIAPYKAQVALSRAHLPEDFIQDTVHKFQGRECSEIVFSTVLDKSRSSQKGLTFVDDPHLVNVAVSRAKEKFTLVTGDDVFIHSNGHIAALVRYIEYYADEKQINRAPVVSAFDLLYKEYDQSLERLNAMLRSSDSEFKSEQIVAQLLRDILSTEAHQGITFHLQIQLKLLVSSVNQMLTSDERAFMENHASCDFVIYFTVGKKPIGVIEVDGRMHETPIQIRRDELKDSILKKSGLPLLRLKTVESHIEEKISAFLDQCASGTVGND